MTTKDLAKILLSNTINIYLKDELQSYIETNNIFDKEYENLHKVLLCIIKDDYDVSSFGLFEIPHFSVYVFVSNNNEKTFDVYLDYFNDGDKEVTIGYVDSSSNTQDAITIKEAIEMYVS